jgi:hypothetical protein
MKKLPIGNCFEDALRFLTTNRDWILVHGVPLGTGGNAKGLRYGHAWLEKDEVVHDPSIDKTFLKNEYYKAGDIKITVRYTFLEAKKFVLGTRQCGPWDRKIWNSISPESKDFK